MTRAAAPQTWALVPAKNFARGKSRLADVLPSVERIALAREMLAHVLAQLAACPGLAGVAVVTDGPDVAAFAERHGAHALRDPRPGLPLGQIVDAGLAALAERGATGAVVLMSDLPRLGAADVQAVMARLADADLVIAPDVLGAGTNALALRLPARLPSCFGHEDSFVRHCAHAVAAGLRVAVVRNARLGFDVDGPADYTRWRRNRKRSSRVSRA